MNVKDREGPAADIQKERTIRDVGRRKGIGTCARLEEMTRASRFGDDHISEEWPWSYRGIDGR